MTGIEQARRSSARTSASRGLPTSVRSPQSTSTSALAEISANSSRSSGPRSSLTCRSPMAAKVNASGLASMASLDPIAHVGESPLLEGSRIVDLRKHSTAADLHARSRQLELSLEPADELVHEPARHAFALARIGPTEVEKMYQEQLPVQVHVAEQTPPIDPIVLLEDDVHDIRTVVAMPSLTQCLGPTQLARR